ncbi:hypothetical protein GGR56DRAFT_648939 [Xylariaceae sp. FL0804]|nr:hypothetical protein GGR56DRAFT_648939 [Xylariaceae sp. FL0804]
MRPLSGRKPTAFVSFEFLISFIVRGTADTAMTRHMPHSSIGQLRSISVGLSNGASRVTATPRWESRHDLDWRRLGRPSCTARPETPVDVLASSPRLLTKPPPATGSTGQPIPPTRHAQIASRSQEQTQSGKS